MTTFEPTCTEPGRWGRAPQADAPAEEILAYLQHCDVCEFHAMLNLEEDLSLDYLLREACRDLDVAEAARPAARPARAARLRRLWPVARAPQPHRFPFEQRLTRACIAAFSIVVLWVGFTAYQQGHLTAPDPVPAEDTVAEVEPLDEATIRLSGTSLAETRTGRLYVSRVLTASESGQPLQAGMLFEEDQLTAAAPGLTLGSVLRVTNPANGLSVEVRVVKRSYEERELHLSPHAAEVLGLDGAALVFVEVRSAPPPPDLAP